MYTQCPECETTFKLGADDLRRARGKVRCGDCNHVFDALDYLAEDIDDEETAAAISDEIAAEGWASSSSNPAGELAPDLDEYEATAYLDDSPVDDSPTDDSPVDDSPADDSPTDEHADVSGHDSETAAGSGQDEDTDDADDEHEDDGAILYIGDDEPAREAGTNFDSSDTVAADTFNEEAEVEFDDSLWERVAGVSPAPEPPTWPDQDELAARADEPDPDPVPDTHTDAVTDNDLDSDPDNDLDNDSDPVIASDEDDLEFNVPQDNWGNFFGPLPKGQSAAVWQPPHLDDEGEAEAEPAGEEAWEELTGVADPAAESMAADTDNDFGEDHAEQETAPSWRGAEHGRSRGYLFLLGGLLLVIALTGQLLHYNRDRLAAHPSWGEDIRAFYAVFDSDLYPDWSVGDYEIRGSEAVAGETGRDVLDIRAQIANTGNVAVGLPRLRVVLRDRWSNPVAAQDFGAAEYSKELAADKLLQPGDMVSAHVSIQDPGSGAQGFELELCLPRRHTGLECSGQPFK